MTKRRKIKGPHRKNMLRQNFSAMTDVQASDPDWHERIFGQRKRVNLTQKERTANRLGVKVDDAPFNVFWNAMQKAGAK